MRLYKLLIPVVCSIALSSCSADNDTEELNGTWKLINATAADGANIEYEEGAVVWLFNDQSHSLTVTTTLMTLTTDTYAGLPGGTYEYYVQKNRGVNYLYVNGENEGAYVITGSNLVLSTSASNQNGTTRVFKR
ncbi:hypothetical protein ACLI1A_04815 [Flavobacterium sp. RHBU_3]|uniref:hypothetical protein n=1 Tax=Flavobacterium sp. RHBU_3 TaxID=3391184 RepID=UPI003984AD31